MCGCEGRYSYFDRGYLTFIIIIKKILSQEIIFSIYSSRV